MLLAEINFEVFRALTMEMVNVDRITVTFHSVNSQKILKELTF
jgi:hypothetical protein